MNSEKMKFEREMQLLGEKIQIDMDKNKVYVYDAGRVYESPLELTDAEKRFILWIAGNISMLEKRNRLYIMPLERAMEIYGVGADKEQFKEETLKMKALHLQTENENIVFGWFLYFCIQDDYLMVRFMPAVKKALWKLVNGAD